jgi:hypothetical protein
MLDRVTITGPDDSIRPEQLILLSEGRPWLVGAAVRIVTIEIGLPGRERAAVAIPEATA